MGFQGQGSADFVYWLSFAIIVGLVVGGAWAVFTLGGLPGRVAARRGHPQAAAIGVCGWLGLVVFVLWPVALVWAYTTPASGQKSGSAEDLDGLLAELRRLSEQVGAIEAGLGERGPGAASSKRVA